MKFINNGTEAVKVKTEGDEKLPPIFKTVKPGDTIEAESDDYIKGYVKDGLTVVKEIEVPKDEKPKDKPKNKSEEKPKDEPKEEKKEAPTPKTKGSKKDKKKK